MKYYLYKKTGKGLFDLKYYTKDEYGFTITKGITKIGTMLATEKKLREKEILIDVIECK